MVRLDNYASVGYALELLGQSPYHRQYKTGAYFRAEILPAIWAGQSRFYTTPQGVPRAMVTWAWVSPEVEASLHSTGRSLENSEWQCGERLFLNDWIAPYGGVRHYVRDLMDNIFTDVEFASSIRRNPDGSVRKINRWHHSKFIKPTMRAAS